MAQNDQTGPQPKRRGRPSTGKRGKFGFRVTDDLKAKLEDASTASGRPVSEEIELRLEASFREPSPHSVSLVGLISSTIAMVETVMRARWIDDRKVALEVKAAVVEMLDKFVAGPAPDKPRALADVLGAPGYRMQIGALGRGLVELETSIGTGQPAPVEAVASLVSAMRNSDPKASNIWMKNLIERLEAEDRSNTSQNDTE